MIKSFIKKLYHKINPSHKYILFNLKLTDRNLLFLNDIYKKIELLENNLHLLNNKINNSNFFIENKLNHYQSELDFIKKMLIYNFNLKKTPKSYGLKRLLQKANLKLLKIITNLAEKKKLNYWIDYGTLLGALRHKGFIPWDEDVDICMLREHYNKIYELINNNEVLKKNYIFAVRSDCLRVYVKGTPIQIDIFPWDIYYKKIENEKEEKLFIDLIIKIKKDLNIKYNWDNLISYKPTFNFSYAKIEEIIKKRINLNKKINRNLKEKSLFRGIECPLNIESNQPERPCNWKIIFPLKKIKFENHYFYAPNKPEERLYLIYKNPFFWDYFREHYDIIAKINLNTFYLLNNFLNKKIKI